MNMENTKINILTIGDCSIITKQIKANISSLFNIEFSNSNYQESLSQVPHHYKNVATILICCDLGQIDTIKEIIRIVRYENPYLPIVGFFSSTVTKKTISELYLCGITNHMSYIQDEYDSTILTQKLLKLISYYERVKILEKKFYENISKNMKNYMELLDYAKTAYVILNTDKTIFDANSSFCNMLGIKQPLSLKGIDFSEFIVSTDIKTLNEIWDAMSMGYCIEDIEMRMTYGHQTIWVNIRGNSVELEGLKILLIIKNLSNKKETDHKSFIEKQKKKDFVKQNINELRKTINEMGTK